MFSQVIQQVLGANRMIRYSLPIFFDLIAAEVSDNVTWQTFQYVRIEFVHKLIQGTEDSSMDADM
jgi:hypothetical protein